MPLFFFLYHHQFFFCTTLFLYVPTPGHESAPSLNWPTFLLILSGITLLLFPNWMAGDVGFIVIRNRETETAKTSHQYLMLLCDRPAEITSEWPDYEQDSGIASSVDNRLPLYKYISLW